MLFRLIAVRLVKSICFSAAVSAVGSIRVGIAAVLIGIFVLALHISIRRAVLCILV